MKKKMHWAFWPCLVFTVYATAQNAPADTIAISPLPGTKILLVGNNMNRLLKENNFEVQKVQFIADMKAAEKEKDFPGTAKEAIYLVAADGRRRLKAKPEELSPFDTQKEIAGFVGNLPPVHYAIYDLPRQFEYHIFLSDPEQLQQLSAVNFTAAVEALKTKEQRPNRFFRIDLEMEGNEWKATPLPTNSRGYCELSTNVAVNLYNSTLAPGIGISAAKVWLNKHKAPTHKLSASLTVQAISEYQDFQFKNIHGALSSDVRFMWNVARNSNRPLWTGLLAGSLRSGTPDSANVKYVLADRRKFGVSSETGFIGIDYSIIPPRGTNATLHNLTFRFRF
ncbi:MAG TPA: hypothetical protein VMR70_09440 [Flavisolibacter sp.]|nr:hypothetical protein [Flavisolibacter sp.]